MRLLEGHPALLVEKPYRAVAVADLHIGFEEELRMRGVRVPLQSRKIVNELAQLVENTDADKLIVVGDLKHNVTGPSSLETEILPKFLSELRKHVDEIIVLPGNHDGRIERILGEFATFYPSRGLFVEEEKLAITHGHAKPHKNFVKASVIVTGHLHPVLRIGVGEAGARLRVWLKLKGSRKHLYEALYGETCPGLKGDVTLLIMPSFNSMLQGRSIVDLSLSKLVRGPLLNTGVFDIDNAEVIALDGSVLGSLGRLREILA
ncbi:MAG: metallophosphoesterase [Candidatus Caldarchaeum sp.]